MARLNPTNDKTVTRRTLHYYWVTTRKKLPMFALAVVATIGFVLFLSFANPYIMGLVIDRIAADPVTAEEVLPVFGPYILALIGVNLLGQACSKLQDYATWKMEIFAKYDLATYVFDKLCRQSMTFHVNRHGGSLVSQTTRFLDAYERLFEMLIFNLVPILATALLTVGFAFFQLPLYGLILLVLLVGYLVLVFVMYKRVLHFNTKSAVASNVLSGELSDSVTNILAVKTCGREAFERKVFNDAAEGVRKAEGRRMRASMERGISTSAILVVIMAVLTLFLTGGNAWFGVSAGTLVAVFSYTYTLTTQMNRLNMTLQGINGGFGNAHEMTVILDEPTLVDDVPGAADLQVREGRIDFENLTFHYVESASEEDVFKDFSLHIPAGQRLGLVGKSGSGKTTLTSLLLRLADLQQGRILIDGQDVSQTTQTSLRQQIAYVPQEPMLFHRTIAENIAYGKPGASMGEIREAARQANALEFIEALPHGFDTQTGERGVKLSGGQRQRVAIARAILTDAPILVLDEATSALDSESEHLVQEALDNLMRGRTCIVVAHRLSTVAGLDRIVVIRDGQIAEDGTHAQLIASGGEYASLWDMQTGAFLE